MKLNYIDDIDSIIYNKIPEGFFEWREWGTELDCTLNIMLGTKIVEQAFIKGYIITGTVSNKEVYYFLLKTEKGLKPIRVTYSSGTLKSFERAERKFKGV